nr:uncharacterized protein LOC112006800 [Quercus suber]
MCNELKGNFDEVAISTLKNGLSTGHGLKKSLTGKPATSMRQLIDRVDKIGDYDVRRVMVNDGSATEVMYPDLYKGLGLKSEDLTPYSSPLMSFDGKLVIPKNMIRLPIQTGLEVVEVNFIVVDTYSPYTAIIGRPWLHTLGAVASSLHQKVKFLSGDQVLEICGSQSTAKQCMVAAISRRLNAQPSATAEEGL